MLQRPVHRVGVAANHGLRGEGPLGGYGGADQEASLGAQHPAAARLAETGSGHLGVRERQRPDPTVPLGKCPRLV